MVGCCPTSDLSACASPSIGSPLPNKSDFGQVAYQTTVLLFPPRTLILIIITCRAKFLRFDWLKAVQLIRNCTAENNTESVQKLYTPLTKLLARWARRAGRMTEAETIPKSIHPYQQQISIKQAQKCINRFFKASLIEWNFVLFKFLRIKNIPALHCKRAYSRREWA